ncbi:MAG: VWA domain-containing protein [Candidatus Omnitrophica bacterium]|nr:hypothetical protein [bacterium]NUN98520.1 VWA domain-containing protein [Candidatus Omnitrophota bacterium]
MEWLGSAFLSPLSALFALSLPAVIVLYLLKLKRKPLKVPSILLWRRSLEDLTANSPFQRLRANPLLFLQLLVLLLLTLALMRPVLHLESPAGIDSYILLDCSASMGATDLSPTRLDHAKGLIRDQIRAMGEGDRMMLVTFAENAGVAAPLTGDKGLLLSALERLRVRETGASLAEAVTILKASIGEALERSRVFLYSDGNIPDTENLLPPAVQSSFIQVGQGGANLGITRFSVDSDPDSSSRLNVFVEVTVDSENPGNATLSIAWDGNLLDAQTIEWSEPGPVVRLFSVPNLDRGLLTATLDLEDLLASDNRAGVYLAPPEPIRVHLVSNSPETLARVLNLIPETVVTLSAPQALSATVEADVVVFDAISPPEIPASARGALLLGGSLPEGFGVGSATEVSHPAVLDWDRNHPATRGAEYRNLQIAKAKAPKLPAEAEVLIEARETALLYALERGERRFLATSFAYFDSNWARLYSFPITLTNAIRWLSGKTHSLAVAEVRRTGEALEIPPMDGEEKASLTGPSGEITEVPLRPGQRSFFSETHLAGTYTADFGGASALREYFNVLRSEETLLSPRGSLKFGKEEIQASLAPRPQNREIWRWAAFAALAFLVLEWWLYTHRAWA